MRIYFAGIAAEERKYRELQDQILRKRLASFFYYTQKDDEFYFHKKNHIMLDSGAYSAHNSGVEVKIEDYMKFLTEHPHIDIYYNLDVIGDAEATWKNQKIMESNGFTPLPVYHVGEDKKWLFKCFDYKWFALGGMVGRPKPMLQNWLDKVFTEVPYDSDGLICNKIHGLGMTNWEFMKRYPWFSCDSSSWIIVCANGCIYLPRFGSNGPDFSKGPSTFSVTRSGKDISCIKEYLKSIGLDTGKSIFEKKPKDYKLQEDELKVREEGDKILVERIIERGISNFRVQRMVANTYFTNEFVRQIPSWPVKFSGKRKRFF